MTVVEVSNDSATFTFSLHELLVLSNVFNEVCNGLECDLETRVGTSSEEVEKLWHKIRENTPKPYSGKPTSNMSKSRPGTKTKRVQPSQYPLAGQVGQDNAGLVDWLLACPEKGLV